MENFEDDMANKLYDEMRDKGYKDYNDIPAEDYDIQNNFGETDHVIDLFAEIEKGYEGKTSIFDDISEDDYKDCRYRLQEVE